MAPPPAAPTPSPLVRTGTNLRGPIRLAIALIIVGALVILATVRSPLRSALTLPGGATEAMGTLSGESGEPGPTRRRRHRRFLRRG